MILSARIYATLVATVLLALFLCAAPIRAEEGKSGSDTKSSVQNSGTRQDNVFGTMDENMTMGRDEDSGDSVMQVRPKPKPKQDSQNTPIIVQPEITITPHGKKQ